MKNVRHDCLLNPLICGPDPFDHDAACTITAPLPIGEGKGLFVYRLFPLPCPLSIIPVADFYFSPEWALSMEQHWGGKKVLHFQLSALGFESTGSNNVHPEQTSTCFLTQTTSWHGKKEVNTGDRSGKQKLHKGLLLNSCRFMGSQTSFPWDLVSFLCLKKQIFQI